MQVLTTILYIVLFIVFLSILIIIHELGHLATAKAFKVYCLEYSIGMGPALFKYKRKGGETQFTLRGIPFGGYVSMYGEGVELPEGVEIDESRSLNGIKPWKRAIILVAGVTMNAVLALTFFFIANCLPQEVLYRDSVNIAEGSLAYESGLRDGDIYQLGKPLTYQDETDSTKKTFYLLDNQTTINNDDSVKYATCLNLDNVTGFKNRDLKDLLFVYQIKDDNPSFADYISPETYTSVQVHFSILKDVDKEKTVDHVVTVSIPTSEGKLTSFGADLFYEKKMNSFGDIIKGTFVRFGDSAVIIFRTIGDLFSKPATWNNVGGIVAVGFETTSVLQNYGFAYFLIVWGAISVNLAIFNLLPFPGLDGWQLLVLAVESIFKKKIPEKVKNIVSLVGIGLLLVFMVVVLAKDLWFYVIKGVFGL